ncbi:MAG: ATP synthase F0 subunit C [Candidatus Adiutrix sp.]|jgi:F-type H+-transporting ATPase subunit c|nr:ATP synthase F0 subunit C [Candidatus Adiutrix sp.]
MKKLVSLLAALAVLATAGVALAADSTVTSAGLATVGQIALAAALAIGLGTIGTGIGQGLSIFSALSGIARNPETAGTIRVNMIIGLALIESLCIYALVVALILVYAFPFSPAVTAIIGG